MMDTAKRRRLYAEDISGGFMFMLEMITTSMCHIQNETTLTHGKIKYKCNN